MQNANIDKLKMNFLKELLDIEKRAAYSDAQGRAARLGSVERLVDRLFQQVEQNETKKN